MSLFEPLFYWTGLLGWILASLWGFARLSIPFTWNLLEHFGMTRDILAAYWKFNRDKKL